ncbi:MAG: hypothetical protein GY862_08810, partial [Gammaproteobacteria bacterium]|nr:hypothetical protein [Gammaproteobacteria bacterium]
EARLKLAKLIADQERHAEARELVSDFKSAVNARIRDEMRNLLHDLGGITLPRDKEEWKRLGEKQRIALAEHRYNDTYRIISRESTQIVKAIEEYYDALAAEDAVRLSAAAGLGVEEAEAMIEKEKRLRKKRGRADRKRVAMIFPQLSLENPALHALRWKVGVYEVFVKDINVVLENEEGKRTIYRTSHGGFVKRVSPGKWTVWLKPGP